MVVCQVKFICQREMSLEQAQTVISELLDELRYNGQILGREFALTLTNQAFICHLVCPEQDAMDPKYFTPTIAEIIAELKDLGIAGPYTEVTGLESQSDFTDVCQSPKGYILYSTFVQSCSPIRCSEHFMPIPLYKLPEVVRKPLIKWQESQAACDQLQMNEMSDVETLMLEQLSLPNSQLSIIGRELLDQIELVTARPCFQYLYRVGGDSFEQETTRRCPSCDSHWRVGAANEHAEQELEPLFGLFDFKCDSCKLLSNISWDWQ